MSNKETGRVLWFNNDKGYGFIQREAGGEVFVHFSAIEASGYRGLEENQIVEFNVVQGRQPGKFQAQSVVILS